MKKILFKIKNIDYRLSIEEDFAEFLEKQGYSLHPEEFSFNKYVFIRREKEKPDPLHRLFCIYKNYFGSPISAFNSFVQNKRVECEISSKILRSKGDSKKFFKSLEKKDSLFSSENSTFVKGLNPVLLFDKKTALEFIHLAFPYMSKSNIDSTFTDENQKYQNSIKVGKSNLLKTEFLRRLFNKFNKFLIPLDIDYSKIQDQAISELEQLLDFSYKKGYNVEDVFNEPSKYKHLKAFIDIFNFKKGESI